MADMMMFPKTVDEFMEKYKIVDTDEVYTNGAELVPIFRMKQWLEHVDAVDVVRCKDCFYSWPFDEEELKEPYRVGEWHCDFWYGEMHEDDYCSCGKRRPDEAPTQKSVDNALEALDEVE